MYVFTLYINDSKPLAKLKMGTFHRKLAPNSLGRFLPLLCNDLDFMDSCIRMRESHMQLFNHHLKLLDILLNHTNDNNNFIIIDEDHFDK